MSQHWIDYSSTVTGMLIASALLFGTDRGQRWLAANRSRLPKSISSAKLAAATSVGVLVAAVLIQFLRFGATFGPPHLVNPLLMSLGSGMIAYYSDRTPRS